MSDSETLMTCALKIWGTEYVFPDSNNVNSDKIRKEKAREINKQPKSGRAVST